jgi:hypothetical protein
MADTRGGLTKGQEQARDLQKFVAGLVSDAKKSPAEIVAASCALGVRITTLAWEAADADLRKLISIHYHEGLHLFIGRSGEDVTKIASDMFVQARLFENSRAPKAANFCRVIVCICDALVAGGAVHRQDVHISRACVKAWYAGADYDQIKATAMLLF